MYPLGKIEIVVPDCPPVVPNVMGIPSWVIGWSFPVGVVILIALFVLIYSLAESRRDRANQRDQNKIAMAKTHKACSTCGDKYEPAL